MNRSRTFAATTVRLRCTSPFFDVKSHLPSSLSSRSSVSAIVAVQRRYRGRAERRRADGARAALDRAKAARAVRSAARVLAKLQAKVRGRRQRAAMRWVAVRAVYAFDGVEAGDLRVRRGEPLRCLRAEYEACLLYTSPSPRD